MAIIKAFKAVRPAQEVAEKVASVPYDVVNRNEAAELASNNPINFLRVTRSEIELDKNTDPYNESVYLKAKENFQKLIDDGHLVQDEEAKFYIYRLIMREQTQFGIAATFSVNDYDNNIIKKHEKTRKVKEDDRTNHIVTTEAQTGAVFLTYKGVDDINLIVEKTVNDNEPLYDFTTHDGVQHTIWAIPTDFNDIITFEIGKVENLYIADGHHRAASASRAQKVKRETVVNQTGAEEYNFFMAVLFPAEQLKILPYNRIVFSLNDLSESEFIENLKENFNLAETGIDSPKNKKEISMYFQKSWYTLTPNENVKAGEKIGDNLDVSILQNYLLNPVLGIEDPRTSINVDFIGGIRGTKELEKRVDSGEAKVAFSLYPVSIDDLIAISDADEIMPPKSTWFEPKLRDGLLVHKI